jgi:hypothetical protein
MQRCGICDNCMSPLYIAPVEESIAVDETLRDTDASKPLAASMVTGRRGTRPEIWGRRGGFGER